MFGLPIETTLLLFGFPIFWIIYTIVFFLKTRSWTQQSNSKVDRS